eukprot:m.19777 g.19777  ORF g.19777 m.19777 type:complete len:88 (-) comp10956_c0_seq1:157-420(-)
MHLDWTPQASAYSNQNHDSAAPPSFPFSVAWLRVARPAMVTYPNMSLTCTSFAWPLGCCVCSTVVAVSTIGSVAVCLLFDCSCLRLC